MEQVRGLLVQTDSGAMLLFLDEQVQMRLDQRGRLMVRKCDALYQLSFRVMGTEIISRVTLNQLMAYCATRQAREAIKDVLRTV